MSSPEAIALLKQDTGIEVKSASSSIEEIVARQFVERHARKRQITLPSGPLFAETAPPKKMGSKAAPEPPKAAPAALRPRLIKTIKPLPVTTPEPAEVETPVPPPLAEEPEEVPAPAPAPVVAARAPEPPEAVEAAPVEPPSAPVEPPEPEVPIPPPAPVTPPPQPAVVARPSGRLVPPTRRLRIEDPVTGEAPAARPIAPR